MQEGKRGKHIFGMGGYVKRGGVFLFVNCQLPTLLFIGPGKPIAMMSGTKKERT